MRDDFETRSGSWRNTARNSSVVDTTGETMSSATTPSSTNDDIALCWPVAAHKTTNHDVRTTSCGAHELGGFVSSSFPFHQESLTTNQPPNVDASRIGSSLTMDSSLRNFTPFGISPNSIMNWNQTFMRSSASSKGSSFQHASLSEDLSSNSLYHECNHHFNNEAIVEELLLSPNTVFLGKSVDHEKPQSVLWASGDCDRQNHPPPMNHQLKFSNNTLFWNASACTAPSSSFPSPSSSQFVNRQKPDTIIKKITNSEATTSTVGTKQVDYGLDGGRKNAFKKPRIETPLTLPTFKVRKEKLGDRITALQQLVAPFGKTDTSSVLQEAIEYIKFLHEQVENSENLKKGDEDHSKNDLRSLGLCLVPIASTFHTANDAQTADFWAPTFGETFM